MSGSLSARQSRTNQPPGSDAVAVPLALARPTTEWHQHIQNRRSDPHIAAQISRGPTGMGRPRCRVGAGGVLFVSGHARSPGCFCGGVWVWVVSVSGMRKPLGACAPRGFLYVWCGGLPPPPEGSQKLAWLWGRSTLASAMHYFTPKRCATSNKIMYHDKAQVQRAADQSLIERGVELWVYRCEFCGCWHLTHRDPQSSYRHVPLNQQLKPHSRKKGYKPRRR